MVCISHKEFYRVQRAHSTGFSRTVSAAAQAYTRSMLRMVAFVLLTGALSWGGPVCADCTLTQYLAMGPSGCDIAADCITFFTTVTLSDFQFSDVSGDSNTDHIRVLPYPNPGSPGVIFTGASFAPVTLDVLITFIVHGPANRTFFWNEPINGDIRATVCAGAPFASDGSCPAPAIQDHFAGFDGSASFHSVNVLGIRDEIVLSGETWPSVNNRIETPGGYGFCECAFPGNLESPEPASFWLIAPLAIALCPALQARHLRNKVDLLTAQATH